MFEQGVVGHANGDPMRANCNELLLWIW